MRRLAQDSKRVKGRSGRQRCPDVACPVVGVRNLCHSRRRCMGRVDAGKRMCQGTRAELLQGLTDGIGELRITGSIRAIEFAEGGDADRPASEHTRATVADALIRGRTVNDLWRMQQRDTVSAGADDPARAAGLGARDSGRCDKELAGEMRKASLRVPLRGHRLNKKKR